MEVRASKKIVTQNQFLKSTAQTAAVVSRNPTATATADYQWLPRVLW